MEISAKQNICVDELFEKIAQEVVKVEDVRNRAESLSVDQKPKKKKCC